MNVSQAFSEKLKSGHPGRKFLCINNKKLNTVNSCYCGHLWDCDLVSILERVCNSGVREKNRRCTCWVYGRGKYADRQDKLTQGDETAKLAYEEKKRGFHFMATRKRIVNSTRKTKAMASNGITS